MTRRAVVWVADAEAELAEIWLASASRDRVASASQAIDSALGLISLSSDGQCSTPKAQCWERRAYNRASRFLPAQPIELNN
jgi:hypothetical protein